VVFFFFLISGAAYGQYVLIRPNSSVGYINVTSPGSNPFGIYSHLGFEYPFVKRFSILAAYQSEIIFSDSVATNNAFMLGLGFHL
jgi:hypothetical protein